MYKIVWIHLILNTVYTICQQPRNFGMGQVSFTEILQVTIHNIWNILVKWLFLLNKILVFQISYSNNLTPTFVVFPGLFFYLVKTLQYSRCAIPDIGENNTKIWNDTYSGWDLEDLKLRVPSGANGGLDSCHLLDPDTNLTTACDRWVYDTQYYKSSRGMEVSELKEIILFQLFNLNIHFLNACSSTGIDLKLVLDVIAR